MKKLFIIALLAQSSVVLADHYHQDYNRQYSSYPTYSSSSYSDGYGYRSSMYPNRGYYSDSYYYQQPQRYSSGYYYQQPSYSSGYSSQPSYSYGYSYQQPQYSSGYYYQQPQSSSTGYYNPQSSSTVYYQQQPSNQTGYYPGQNYLPNTQYQQNPRYTSADGRYDQNMNDDQDRAILEKIHDELSNNWFSKGYSSITYSVNDGVVDIRGTVKTQDDKSNIEANIRKINGVKNVRNDITVNPNMNPTNAYDSNRPQSYNQMSNPYMTQNQDFAASEKDRQINDNIRNKLSNARFSNANIAIRTSNGDVTIEGKVDKAADIQKINDEISNVDGVRNINNRLQLK